MNVAKFSLYMLKREKSKSFFYIFSCTFSVLMMYLFLNIIYNEYYQRIDILYAGNFNSIFSVMLSFLVIAIIVGMNFYAYNFYLTSQTKEIGIYLLGGSSLFRLFYYLFVQNMVIFGLSFVFGILLGFVLIPLVNAFINYVCSTSYPIYTYSSTAFWGTVAMIGLELAYLAIVSTGFIHRHEIKDLMGMTREVAKKDERIIVLPNFIYIFFMVAPCIIYFTVDAPDFRAIIVFVCLLCGFTGFCKYVVPEIIEKLQRKVFIDKKITLISSAHIHHGLVESCSMLQFFLIIVIFMNTYAVVNVADPMNMALVIVAYVSLVISVIMSFYYKILLVSSEHKRTFKHLFKMGYKKQEIAKMVKQEIFVLYFIAFIVASFHVGLFYISCIAKGMIEIKWMFINMSIFIIAIIICGLVNYYTYKNEVLKEIR